MIESPFSVVGNLFSSKAAFASYFGVSTREIIPLLADAIHRCSQSNLIEGAPCQEVVVSQPDLGVRSNRVDVLDPLACGRKLDFHHAVLPSW